MSIENVSRRHLLQGMAAGTLVLACAVRPAAALAAVGDASGANTMPHGVVIDPRVFVAIDATGQVTIVAHRAEMGTGVRTSLPMVVAEELDADWSRVRVVQAPGDEARYGNQDTDGSRSTRHFLQPMRDVGAAARAMLEAAAAHQWNVAVAEVRADFHTLLHVPTGRRLGFGEVAAAAADATPPDPGALRFKPPSTYRYVGTGRVAIVDLHDITTGRAKYGADVRLPGMKYAVIARPPVVGGQVVSFDPHPALAVPGVEQVLQVKGWPWPSKFQPLGGVAVIARNTGAAIKGRAALNVVWSDGPNAVYDSAAYRTEIETTSRNPGTAMRKEGDAEAALAAAAQVVTAEYYLPHLAHVSMEPPVATAHVTADRAEVWAPVQSAGGTREDLARTLGLPPERVTVHVTLLGGGFGRKSKCDYALEAALLSQALNAPVRVQWTREDDVRHDFLHTVSAERVEAGLDHEGRVTAWRHRSVAPTIFASFKRGADQQSSLEAGMGLVDMPFAIDNVQIETGRAAAHARIGWFRSVSNIPHAFAVQSMVGELAHAAGRDQKEMLLALLGPDRVIDLPRLVPDLFNYAAPYETYPLDTGRLRRTIELAANEAGWGRGLPAGHGMGIAAHHSFTSYVATVIEVAIAADGTLSVPRVDTAIDCGPCINPERVRSQLEGAAIMGLSLAKYGEITFKAGRVQQGNFDDFPVVRIDEAPTETRVHIMPASWDAPPCGVGEPGVPPFAPALCHAIFAATGKRIRSLPIGQQLKA